MVVSGPSSLDLGNSIANCLNVKSVPVDLRVFSDGESKVKISADLSNKICIVVQSTYPPVDSNFMQTLMIISNCYNAGASEVIAVVPYMGYARQDRVFLEGELITISLIANLFECVGIKNLITVDIHSLKALSYFKFNAINISSICILADYAIKNFNLDNPIVISPDVGGIDRAKAFSKRLNSPFFGLNKSRNRITGDISIEEKLEMDITNHDIILLDDMISSGGTILKAIEILKKNNCRRIFVMCVHLITDEKSLTKIKESGISEIVSTNSVPKSCSNVDLSGEISKALYNILS